MKITELFEPGKEWKWSFVGSEEAAATFIIGGVRYLFKATTSPDYPGIWELEFQDVDRKRWPAGDEPSKYGLTGTGNSAEVMSTITDILRSFLTKYQGKISQLEFSAEESSRKALYAKMASRLLPDWTLARFGRSFVLTAPTTQLAESTSLDTTLKAITNDIGEPITNVYDTMKFQAKKYMDNHGELERGFRMVAAGVGGRWVQSMYIDRLKNELYDLCKYNPRNTADLKEFLRGVELNGELEMKRSFGSIANTLPGILIELGQRLNVPQLTKNAHRWIQNKEAYERYLSELEMEADDSHPPVKAPKSTAAGLQNVQIDQIVNSVLSRLPSNVQGDIRNAIARSPNKLQALQAELQKRNIKVPVSESNSQSIRFAKLEFDTVAVPLAEVMSYLLHHGKLYSELNTNENYFPQNLYSSVRRSIKETVEQNEITPFLDKLQTLDYKGNIKVGDLFSVLNFDINFSSREIDAFGFINPKEIAKIVMASNGKINYLMFSDGDRYPRQTPATYSGKPIVYAVYFGSAQDASKALTMLSLSVPSGWDMHISDPLTSSVNECEIKETTLVDEGWKDWVAGATLGAAALGAQAGHHKPVQMWTEPAPTQTQKATAAKAAPAAKAAQSTGNVDKIIQTILKPEAKALISAGRAAGMKGAELAQFIAQCAHESANFTQMKEFGGRLDFKKYDPAHNPSKAKQLGNKQTGDGARYHGRGYIQLTGRDNYTRAGQALGLPLAQHPDLVERPDIAAKVAVWFWQNRVAPKVTNFNDTAQVTKPINSGLKGLDDRHTKFSAIMQLMKRS